MAFDFQKVRLISLTKPVEGIPEFWLQEDGEPAHYVDSAEDLISFVARVSNPANQANFSTAQKLLAYCIRKHHWSVFEMGDATFEIETTRDIGRQILRHRSFSFQEFSQRYAEAGFGFPDPSYRQARLQDPKNRQNSIGLSANDPNHTQAWWTTEQRKLQEHALAIYQAALDQGIAKECARVVLPEGLTMSKMYMKGSIRSWITYCLVRLPEDSGTQLEHRDIADKIAKILSERFHFFELAIKQAEQKPDEKSIVQNWLAKIPLAELISKWWSARSPNNKEKTV